MDRLTVKSEEGFDYSKESLLKFDERGCITGYSDYCLRIVWKLAEYENIGLEPYQLRELDKIYLEKCEEANRLNKELAEYKKAEEQGMLLRLPCKVGDTVYAIEVNEEEFEHFYCSVRISEYKFELKFLPLIGKCIFLTREEAEQALKQMGE